MALVEVENLSFRYDHNYVLERANLTIEQGDYMGIIGPNGSAKSTLIKLILGILTPEKGRIKLFGQSLKQFDDWQHVGYVAQSANTINANFPATVYEIIRAGLYAVQRKQHLSRKQAANRLDHVMQIVGITALKNRLIGNLSGGQQQKIFIARALVSQPKILFLDEPTSGIDARSQLQFYELLKKLNTEYGVTIVMVSHDIGMITEKANKFACMEGGKVYLHEACCAVPVGEFIKRIYGDQMHVITHHRHHDEVLK